MQSPAVIGAFRVSPSPNWNNNKISTEAVMGGGLGLPNKGNRELVLSGIGNTCVTNNKSN